MSDDVAAQRFDSALFGWQELTNAHRAREAAAREALIENTRTLGIGAFSMLQDPVGATLASFEPLRE